LALSLSLLSPSGYVISGHSASRGTPGTRGGIARYSPEPNVLDYQNVARTISNDSDGGWGEIVLHSPRTKDAGGVDASEGEESPRSLQSPTSEIDVGAYKESEESANKDSGSRVKQFLFHRDRDRARKTQLLYNAAYGSVDLTHEGEDGAGEFASPHTSMQTKLTSTNIRGGSANAKSRSSQKNSAEKFIRIDLETDIRAGTNGIVFTPSTVSTKKSRSPRTTGGTKASSVSAQSTPAHGGNHHSASPYTPYSSAARPIPVQKAAFASPPRSDTADANGEPFNSHSPYYRALTLGFPSPAAADAKLRRESVARSASVSSTGSSLSAHSPRSPTSRPAEPSAEAYEQHFPALPVTKNVPTSCSALSAITLTASAAASGIAEDPLATPGCAEEAPVAVLAQAMDALRLPAAAPKLPTYTAEDITAMLGAALAPSDVIATDADVCTSKTGAVRAMRAWDDADSDSDEESGATSSNNSVASDNSHASSTQASLAVLQRQVQKLADIDATCANLLQKCDYIYNKLKTPAARVFDLSWLQSMVAPFLHPAGGLGSTAHAVVSTGTGTAAVASAPLSLLELFARGYVHGALVYQLVQAVQSEDHRFDSPRLPLLYALYAADPSGSTASYVVRNKIASALEYTCRERYQRCADLLALATALEIDVNYISKVGYSELCNCDSGACHFAAAQGCLTAACDLTAVIESENERPSYKTRDSDSNLIELTKFIIAQEVSAALAAMQQQEEACNSWSGETKSGTSYTAPADLAVTCAEAAMAPPFPAASKQLLLSLTSAYCALFRCYTHKLGACFTGSSDSVEQPVLLENLQQCLDGLLAWAKILCNLQVPDTGNASVDSRSVLDEVCELILSATAKQWTAQCNYAQDIAYMLQSEVLLTVYAPQTPFSAQGGRTYLANAYKSQGNQCTLPPLNLLSGKSTHAQRNAAKVLSNLLARVTSVHTKVATQAIQSLQNPVLMVRYFLPRMPTAMVSYIFGTEVGRITFISGAGKFCFLCVFLAASCHWWWCLFCCIQ
jgi:hypothetical protein